MCFFLRHRTRRLSPSPWGTPTTPSVTILEAPTILNVDTSTAIDALAATRLCMTLMYFALLFILFSVVLASALSYFSPFCYSILFSICLVIFLLIHAYRCRGRPQGIFLFTILFRIVSGQRRSLMAALKRWSIAAYSVLSLWIWNHSVRCQRRCATSWSTASFLSVSIVFVFPLFLFVSLPSQALFQCAMFLPKMQGRVPFPPRLHFWARKEEPQDRRRASLRQILRSLCGSRGRQEDVGKGPANLGLFGWPVRFLHALS